MKDTMIVIASATRQSLLNVLVFEQAATMKLSKGEIAALLPDDELYRNYNGQYRIGFIPDSILPVLIPTQII